MHDDYIRVGTCRNVGLYMQCAHSNDQSGSLKQNRSAKGKHNRAGVITSSVERANVVAKEDDDVDPVS